MCILHTCICAYSGKCSSIKLKHICFTSFKGLSIELTLKVSLNQSSSWSGPWGPPSSRDFYPTQQKELCWHYTWDPPFLGKSIFCLVEQKTLLDCSPPRTGSGHPCPKSIHTAQTIVATTIHLIRTANSETQIQSSIQFIGLIAQHFFIFFTKVLLLGRKPTLGL